MGSACKNGFIVIVMSFHYTLPEINISHLRKRKLIFKIAFFGGYVSSLEGNHLVDSDRLGMDFFHPSLHRQDRTLRKSWRRVPVWQVTATGCRCEHLSTSDTNLRKPRHKAQKWSTSPKNRLECLQIELEFVKPGFPFSKWVIFIDVQGYSVSYFTPLHHHDFTGAPSAITSSSRKAKSFSSWLVVFFNLIHGSTLQWLSGVVKSTFFVHSNCGILYRPRSFERWQPSQYQGLSLQPAAAASLSISNACHLIVWYGMIHAIILYPISNYTQYQTIPNSMYSPMIDFKEIIAGFAVTKNSSKSFNVHGFCCSNSGIWSNCNDGNLWICLGDIGLLIAGCNSFWSLFCSNSDLRWQRGIYKKSMPPLKKCQSTGNDSMTLEVLTYISYIKHQTFKHLKQILDSKMMRWWWWWWWWWWSDDEWWWWWMMMRQHMIWNMFHKLRPPRDDCQIQHYSPLDQGEKLDPAGSSSKGLRFDGPSFPVHWQGYLSFGKNSATESPDCCMFSSYI